MICLYGTNSQSENSTEHTSEYPGEAVLNGAHRSINVNINFKHNPVPQNQKSISPHCTANAEMFHGRAALEGSYYQITPAL